MPGDKVKYVSYALSDRNFVFDELLAVKGKKKSAASQFRNFILLTKQGYIYNLFKDPNNEKQIIEMYP